METGLQNILQDIIPPRVDLHMIKYITINISHYHL